MGLFPYIKKKKGVCAEFIERFRESLLFSQTDAAVTNQRRANKRISKGLNTAALFQGQRQKTFLIWIKVLRGELSGAD